MPKPRLVLAEDHAPIVEVLRNLLAPDFEVVASPSNGQDLVTETERLQPDAVLLDMSLPVLSGLEAARRVRQIAPAVKILFVTQRAEHAYVKAAFAAGASAYVLKQCVISELVPALHQVLAGQRYLTPQLATALS